MQRCKAALLKTSALTEEKWAIIIITAEMTSSKESDAGMTSSKESDAGSGETSTLIKHPLPWRE